MVETDAFRTRTPHLEAGRFDGRKSGRVCRTRNSGQWKTAYGRTGGRCPFGSRFVSLHGWLGPTKIEGHTIPISVPYTPGAKYLAYTVREPVGVVGADHSLELSVADGGLETGGLPLGHGSAPKCSSRREQTPLSCLRLGELMQEAGIPDGCGQYYFRATERTAGGRAGGASDVDKIAFTGSTEVGKLILHAAGREPRKRFPSS